VVFVPLLSRHFVRHRGMAISIVQSANGLGRAVSAPLVQLGVSGIGWRPTYLVQAVLMAAVVLPLARLFRRADPVAPAKGDGTVPEGSSSALPTAGSRSGWTLSEAMHTPHFWLLFAVYLFTGLGSFFVSLHQLAFAIDIGFDRIYAAGVLGIGRDQLRVLTDRVGGSFGMKQPTYAEYYCILHAARALGRPVKWTDDRSGSRSIGRCASKSHRIVPYRWPRWNAQSSTPSTRAE